MCLTSLPLRGEFPDLVNIPEAAVVRSEGSATWRGQILRSVGANFFFFWRTFTVLGHVTNNELRKGQRPLTGGLTISCALP